MMSHCVAGLVVPDVSKGVSDATFSCLEKNKTTYRSIAESGSDGSN